jgi:hypothetical protein
MVVAIFKGRPSWLAWKLTGTLKCLILGALETGATSFSVFGETQHDMESCIATANSTIP